jgi:hypothetical protein
VKNLLIALVVAVGGIPWPASDYSSAKSVCSEPPPDTARTILGIRVQKTAVRFAERILGPSPLRSQGQGGEHVTWRCWEAANGDGTVLYVSRGEVEGQLRVLGAEMLFPGRGSCPKSQLVHRGIATDGGLRLGLSQIEAQARLGAPTIVNKDSAEWVCEARRQLTPQEAAARRLPPGVDLMDIVSIAKLVLSDSKVVGFEIQWQETY